MDQHWTVGFFKDIPAHLDLVVGSDRHQVCIKSGVVKRAKGDAVRYRRGAKRLAITDDMGGFQELLVPQTTDRAMTPIRVQYSFTEFLLMEPLLNHPCDISDSAAYPG